MLLKIIVAASAILLLAGGWVGRRPLVHADTALKPAVTRLGQENGDTVGSEDRAGDERAGTGGETKASTEKGTDEVYAVREVEELWSMGDGAKLPVSVFLPVAERTGLAFPAVIFVHPWACDKTVFDRMAERYAGRGYIGVTYTVRGWYGTEGEIGCIDPEYEMKDLKHVITLLSEDTRFPVLQDDKGPVVGVTGYSMGGVHSYLIAPRRNPRSGDPGDRRVRAVVPMHGGADLLFSLYPNGGVKFLWSSLLLVSAYMGNLSGLLINFLSIVTDNGLNPWERLCKVIEALWKVKSPISSVTSELTSIYNIAIQRRIQEADSAKQFLKMRSARYWCDAEMDGRVEHPISVPTLVITGWKDDLFLPNEGLRAFSSLIDAPRRIIITNHGHMGGMVGDLFPGVAKSSEASWLEGEVERWFDRYLKGIDNGVEKEPGVMFYRDSSPELYGKASSWPLPGTREVGYFLGGSGNRQGVLSPVRPNQKGEAPDLLINIGMTGSVSLPYLQDFPEVFGGKPLDIPERIDLAQIPWTTMDYQTAPLERDLTIMGIPRLVVYCRSSQSIIQLVPWLYEVTRNGREILVSRGYFETYNPRIGTLSSTEKDPIEMAACYHRFPAGSRIKLEIATADLGMTWSYWSFSLIRILHDKNAPSRLILPVVPKCY
jgi:putative CocE/NonD family hydrolase